MHSSKNSSQQPHQDPFTGWCTLIGAAVGLAIGLFTRHWLAWTTGLAVVGWLTGAFVDRSRRQ